MSNGEQLARRQGRFLQRNLPNTKKQQKKENKNGFFSKLTDNLSEKGKSEFSALPAVSGIKDAQKQFEGFSIDKAISRDDLGSLKEIDSMKSGLNDKAAKYQQQIKTLKYDEDFKAASTQLSDIGKIKINTVQDAADLKSKLDSLNKTKDALQQDVKQVQDLKARADADFGSEKDLLDKLNSLKDKDIKALSDKYKIPSFTTGGIAKSLFGPAWMARVDKTLYYIQLARKYMPPKKKKTQPSASLRVKGTDVSFPRENMPPDFLIEKTSLSGTTGGAGKPGVPLDFNGSIVDITSDQAMLGRPTKFEINGSNPSKTLKVDGVLDHRTDDATDTFSFKYSGLTAAEMNLPQSEYLPSFDKGSGSITGTFTLKDENIDASVDMNITNFSLPQAEKNDETKQLVASLWAGIDTISVSARLTGKIDKLDVSVSSNIDKMLGDRLSKLFGEKVAEMQNRIKSEVERLTNEKKAELTAQFNAKRNEVMNMYADKQKEAQGKLDELNKLKEAKQNEANGLADKAKKQAEDALNAQKQQAQAAVDAEKKKAQAQADAAKKKAEDEAQKKVQEQLKGLFGK